MVTRPFAFIANAAVVEVANVLGLEVAMKREPLMERKVQGLLVTEASVSANWGAVEEETVRAHLGEVVPIPRRPTVSKRICSSGVPFILCDPQKNPPPLICPKLESPVPSACSKLIASQASVPRLIKEIAPRSVLPPSLIVNLPTPVSFTVKRVVFALLVTMNELLPPCEVRP